MEIFSYLNREIFNSDNFVKCKKSDRNGKDNNKYLTSFEDHLDQQYGVRGTPEREEFEEGFEVFMTEAMIQDIIS